MPFPLPRVEAVLGAPVGRLTVSHLQAAIAANVEEAADLDFKKAHYPDTNEGKEELAKDVAAFANHVGGLLVIGIRDEQSRAVQLTPVSLVGDPANRYRQILLSRITPYVRDVNIFTPEVPGDPEHGVVLIAVPRSLLAPHGVFREHDAQRRMFFPVRSGTDTHYLTEAELAEFYRTRFAGAAAQAARLDRVQVEGRLRLRESPIWLAISLVPALPGAVPPTNRLERASHLAREWASQQPWQEQIIPGRLAGQLRATIGVRRAILPRGGDWRSERLHVELHDDGSGYAAVPCGEHSADRTVTNVPLRQFAMHSLWLTSLLVQHAIDAGAAGEAMVAAELLLIDPGWPVRVIDDDDWSGEDQVSESFVVRSSLLPDESRPAATSLSVDLSALAVGVQPVARIAAQLAGELAAVFGVADLDILTVEGKLRVEQRRQGARGFYLYSWAQQNGLLADNR